MVLGEIIIAVVVFLLLYLSNFLGKGGFIVQSTLLASFFMFALVSFDLTIIQAVFYPIALLFAIAFYLFAPTINYQTDTEEANLPVDLKGSGEFKTKRFKGIGFHFITLIIGFILLLFMFLLQGQTKSQIVGTPTLAIATTTLFSVKITTLFASATSGALGFIENRFIVGIVQVLIFAKERILRIFVKIPLLGQLFLFLGVLLPYMIGAGFFAILHVIAFGLVISSILWAFFVMCLWLASYVITKDDTSMNTAHYWWNSIIQIGRNLPSI